MGLQPGSNSTQRAGRRLDDLNYTCESGIQAWCTLGRGLGTYITSERRSALASSLVEYTLGPWLPSITVSLPGCSAARAGAQRSTTRENATTTAPGRAILG